MSKRKPLLTPAVIRGLAEIAADLPAPPDVTGWSTNAASALPDKVKATAYLIDLVRFCQSETYVSRRKRESERIQQAKAASANKEPRP